MVKDNRNLKREARRLQAETGQSYMSALRDAESAYDNPSKGAIIGYPGVDQTRGSQPAFTAPMPGKLNEKVFEQDTYWADGNGNMLELVAMTPDHLRNVLNMLERRRKHFWLETHADKVAKYVREAILYSSGYMDADGDWSPRVPEYVPSTAAIDEWFEATPLVMKLRSILTDNAPPKSNITGNPGAGLSKKDSSRWTQCDQASNL